MTPAGELIDLIGRIMFTHSISAEHVQAVLGGEFAEAVAVVEGEHPSRVLEEGAIDKLRVFATILLRLEWRLSGDSAAIRDALVMPMEVLGGASPAERLAGCIEDMRAIRLAVDAITVPETRWWRVGH